MNIMRNYIAVLLLLICVSACSDGKQGAELLAEAEEYAAKGDGGAAMVRATDALERGLDSAQTSRAYLVIAGSHHMAGNLNAAMEFTRQAAEYDPAARPALALAATDAGEPELALSILAQITPPDSAARMEWLRNFIAPAIATNRHADAIEALRELYADSVMLPLEYRVLLAREYPQDESAILSDIDLNAIADPEGLEAYAELMEEKGRSSLALPALHRAAAVRDSIMRAATASGVYNRLYEIEHERHLADSAKSRRRTLAAGATTIFIIAIAATLIYIQKVRSRRKILEAENRLLIASNELRAISEQQRSTIGRLFRGSFESIEMAANLLLDGAATQRVMKELNARVDTSRSPEFMSELEKTVNECHNGIISRMRSDLSLNDTDVSTALYCATGLSPRVICLLLDCSPTAFYNKKYRLKRKISESELPDQIRADYLSILS